MSMLGDYEAAVDRFQRMICTFARYTLRDGAEAEDVTQEVLLKMWRHQRKLDEKLVKPWLIRVTRNACIDRLRKRMRLATPMARAEPASPEGDFFERLRDTGPSPAEAAETSELRRRLSDELSGLEDPYRSIVILREVEGLKYHEIADALEMPLNTVKVYLHRGRLKLRERLRGEAPFAGEAAANA